MGLRLFATIVILTGSLFGADPALLSLAMPDTQFAAGVNVEQVVLSPLGQYLMMQSQQQSDAGLQKLVEATGFDPRHDLREILVVASGQAGGASTGIVMARGTFNVPRILEAALALGATVDTYKDVQILQGKAKGQPSVAFLDASTAILGEPANVRAAIDRKSAPAAISSALAVAVNLASTTEDAWFVTLAPPSRMQPQLADAQGPIAVVNKIMQASGGVKFGANLVLTIKGILPTAQDAKSLADLLKSFIGLAQMSAQDAPSKAAAAALAKNLDVSADGSTMKIAFSIPEPQLEEILKSKNPAASK
jgi:hypothetical protein